MTTLHHDVRIDAPVEQVWRALGDLVAVQEYNPMVASARCISPKSEGVGAMRRCELKPKGWVEERVWEWAPPNAIGLEVSASEWPLVFMKWRTELLSEGSGTLVRQEMSYRVKFGPVGALMDALVMRKKLQHDIAGVFAALKRYVETGAPITARESTPPEERAR